MNSETGQIVDSKALQEMLAVEQEKFIPLTDEEHQEVNPMSLDERVEWAKKKLQETINPDTFIVDGDEETKFSDVEKPTIGVIPLGQDPDEIDISHMNRQQRRKLMQVLKLKFVDDSKSSLSHDEEVKRRRKFRKKHNLR